MKNVSKEIGIKKLKIHKLTTEIEKLEQGIEDFETKLAEQREETLSTYDKGLNDLTKGVWCVMCDVCVCVCVCVCVYWVFVLSGLCLCKSWTSLLFVV